MMLTITMLVAVMFTAFSGLALVIGLDALAKKCQYRALKVSSGIVAVLSAVFLSGVVPHLSLSNILTPNMLITVMGVVSIFFITVFMLSLKSTNDDTALEF